MTATLSPSPSTGHDESAATAADDYSLQRVPPEARYGWFSVAMQRFGMLSALAQFMLAASIGIGLSFWDAMLAITIGSVVLEALTILVGIAGQREGLSTSPLARWSGFGTGGSAIVGVVMALSLVGWFAIQNAVFAEGLHRIAPAIPLWALCILGGLIVTGIVVFGFNAMNWVAWVAVPAFLGLCLWAIYSELSNHTLGELLSSGPSGTPISMGAATTMVAGGFIVGAIFTPDMSRFNRTPMDVIKQTIVGVTFGEYFVGVVGVLLAHALKVSVPADAGVIVGIIQSTSGVMGVLVLALSIIKVNDWNLYPSSLGIVNAVHVLTGRHINRGIVAAGLGVLGSVLSAIGMAEHITPFLLELGVLCPPIAAILIADYFVCRSWRGELDASRASGALPATAPRWVPAGLVAWVVGWLAGRWASANPQLLDGWLVPALTSVLVAFVVHVALGRLGLARGVGIHETH
ncbi:purine-cytosine permease family protein [Arsenicicoccus dermatophilus]|uniref:purine-cytosine permease family protein n=1 Tax=Arsenicicoccus dermatophilus TaxID=1076331 RepID=UPI001F4CDC48|nr:cytosine permease [Arsenicicoccus dermatophilus]MCH8612172.1 cytosine permease [Arsenicicoccus dermatophilus]